MKKLISLVVSVLMIFALASLSIRKPVEVSTDGSITVVLINENGDIVESKEIEFYKGDNLFFLVRNNFEITFQEFSFGVMILSIGEIYSSQNYFISISVNGVVSMVGITLIEFQDGDSIEFSLLGLR
jgi:hypothetical protein